MEKYTKWRDPATGIHPFLPFKTEYGSPLLCVLWTLKRAILGPVLVFVRLVLIAIVFAWLIVFSCIFNLIPVPVLKRFFKSYVQFLGGRVLLFFMGFYWIKTKYSPLSKQRGKDANKGTPGFNIKSGDVIISNLTSYVDILYLVFRFAPSFAIAPNTWKETPPQGKVIRFGLLGLLNEIVNFPVHTPVEARPLNEVAMASKREGNGPLVVFPEGTTSNGHTILDGLPVLATGDVGPSRVHVLGFKYDYEDFSPSFTVGSFFWHLLRLLSQGHNTLQVRYMTIADMPPLPLDGSCRQPVDSDKAEWADAVHNNLASILQVRKSTLNTKDKREFLKYWNSHKRSYKEN